MPLFLETQLLLLAGCEEESIAATLLEGSKRCRAAPSGALLVSAPLGKGSLVFGRARVVFLEDFFCLTALHYAA